MDPYLIQKHFLTGSTGLLGFFLCQFPVCPPKKVFQDEKKE